MKQGLWIVLALVVAAILGALWMRGIVKNREAQDYITLLEHRVKATDTVYRIDTLYFTRTLKVEVAKRDTVLKHLTDTVLVKQFIAAADTAIRACQSVVLTCEQRVAQRDSIIKAYQSLKPSRISIGIQGTCGYGIKGRDCLVGLGASFKLW